MKYRVKEPEKMLKPEDDDNDGVTVLTENFEPMETSLSSRPPRPLPNLPSSNKSKKPRPTPNVEPNNRSNNNRSNNRHKRGVMSKLLNKIKSHIIQDWRDFLKFWSVRLSLIGTVLSAALIAFPDAWNVMPQTFQSAFPERYTSAIAIFFFVASMTARVFRQKKLEAKNNLSKPATENEWGNAVPVSKKESDDGPR